MIEKRVMDYRLFLKNTRDRLKCESQYIIILKNRT